EPVRDAGKGVERERDLLVRHAEGARRSRRGGGVLAVVAAAESRLRGQRVVPGELDATPRHPLEATRHDGDLATFEDAQLRRPVRLERAMPVEVVGLEVEQD